VPAAVKVGHIRIVYLTGDNTLPKGSKIMIAFFCCPGKPSDVLDGVGVPAKWVNSLQKAQALDDAAAKQAQLQNMLATVNAGADTAKKVADAGQALQPISGSAGDRVNNQI